LLDNILFDLDGTLTDSAEGIVKSYCFALESLGQPLPSLDRLRARIGPPVEETFAVLLQTTDPHTILAAVTLYRERYSSVGLFENRVYPGVIDMLQAMRNAGKRLYLATSKPLPYARRILDRFGLSDYFAGTHGSALDRPNTGKVELIASVLAIEGLAADATIMVGDRKHDIIGACENGVFAVGAAYGYGSEAELREAGAHAVYHSPTELQHGLLSTLR
jgi:phosphoglycolate phosphatase